MQVLIPTFLSSTMSSDVIPSQELTNGAVFFSLSTEQLLKYCLEVPELKLVITGG